ncbi:hypothetical protein G6F56_011923 [Rhizopus delemar]|nr:hypothetical protein G6F56_011923 [Rhizopus delemar]
MNLHVEVVRIQHQVLNYKATAKDLIRIGHLAKDASDKNQARLTFGFLVVGNHGTFYIIHRAQELLYLMCEIEHVQLPMFLAEIPLFFAQMDKVMKVITGFAQAARQENHDYDNHPLTLTDHTVLEIIHPNTSRKRKSITSHYTY